MCENSCITPQLCVYIGNVISVQYNHHRSRKKYDFGHCQCSQFRAAVVEYLTLCSGLIHFLSTEALQEATLNHFDNILCVSSKGVNSPPPAALLPTVAPCSQRAAPNTYSGKEVVNVVAGIQCHADIFVLCKL